MIKVKQQRTADCVVGGFRYAEKKKEVGSLLLGLYDDDGLLDHVGFTSAIPGEGSAGADQEAREADRAAGLHRQRAGRAEPLEHRAHRRQWQPLKPMLVVEVRYDQVTGAPLPPRHRLPPLAARQGRRGNARSTSSRPSFARPSSRSCSATMSLLFDTPLIAGLRYARGAVIGAGRGAGADRPARGARSRAVPLPRLARQPQDAELRLALRFRRCELHAGRAHSRLAAAAPRQGRRLRRRRRRRTSSTSSLARYDPGAGIGWHRDRDVFEQVVGISLGTPGDAALPPANGRRLQARQPRARAALGLSAVGRGAPRLGAQHRAGRAAALLDHLPHIVATRAARIAARADGTVATRTVCARMRAPVAPVAAAARRLLERARRPTCPTSARRARSAPNGRWSMSRRPRAG